jgi:hypothetical protein
MALLGLRHCISRESFLATARLAGIRTIDEFSLKVDHEICRPHSSWLRTTDPSGSHSGLCDRVHLGSKRLYDSLEWGSVFSSWFHTIRAALSYQ